MSSNYLAERERQAQDIYRVHNILMDDYVVKWDLSRTNTPWLIPAANKDSFGAGRGNRDVPFYIALKFMKEVVDIKIMEDAKKEWDKLRKEYSKTDQVAREEERLMTNFLRDERRRDEYRKRIWLGLIQRHGDQIRERQVDQVTDRTKPAELQALERLGLNDRLVEENKEIFLENVEQTTETTE